MRLGALLPSRDVKRQHELNHRLAVHLCHLLPKLRHRLASGRNADELPNVLEQFSQAVLLAEPLVVILSVARLGCVVPKPLRDIRIKVVVHQFVHELSPILRALRD